MSDWTDWVRALESRGQIKLRDNGNAFTTRCPSHDDHRDSLSVKRADDGKVLAHCFTGCTFEEIRDSLGLGRDSSESSTPRSAPPPKPAASPPKPSRLPSGQGVRKWNYYDSEGELVFAVTRQDPGKKFLQWTPTDDPNLWIPRGPTKKKPLYRLADILRSDGTVAIVEGEKCADACRTAWPTQTITTWAGGANAWQTTDWTPLRGRTVSIVADADHIDPKKGTRPGHVAARGIAVILLGLGCKVKLALPMPTGPANEDIEDWLRADGVDDTARRVADMLEDFDGSPPPESDPPTQEVSTSELENNQHFRILGLEGARILVRLKRAGQIERYSRESVSRTATLISLAPETWWCGSTGAPQLSDKVSRQCGDAIIRIADVLGQIDTTAILGMGAVKIPGGTVAFHLGNRILADGKEHPLDWPDDVVWEAGPAVPLAAPATADQMREFALAVLDYRWASQMDGYRLLGWMVAALHGGALSWRPHISFVAESGHGKSWIIREVLRPIMGPLVNVVSDATAAAIARMTAHSSIPLLIDEAEPTAAWLAQLLDLLRVASGGDGMRVRADQGSSGVTRQFARFSAMLSSTRAPRLKRADVSRLTPLRLGAAVEDWAKVEKRILDAAKHAAAIRSRIIQDGPAIVATAEAIGREMQSGGMESREALSSASLTAGWREWGVEDTKWIYAMDMQGFEDRSDAADLLRDILAIRLRAVDGNIDKDLSRLIIDEPKRIRDLYGLRFDEGWLRIAYSHSGLKNALNRTDHGNVDLRSVLMQLSGANISHSALAFGAIRLRAVEISPDTLDELGIELGGYDADTDSNSS